MDDEARSTVDNSTEERLAQAVAAVDAEPSSAARHLALAAAYEEAGQAAGAEQHYRLAADLDPTDAEAHYRLGFFLKERDRAAEARAEFEEYLERARPGTGGAVDPVSEGKALLAGGWGLAYEKCAACGCISTLGSLYRPGGKGKLCPRCRGQAQIKRALPGVWTGLLAAVVLVLTYLAARPLYYIYANTLLIIGSAILLAIPHELGHAAAAWLLGGRVFEIRFGAGPARWEKLVRGTWLSLGKYPVTGRCAAAFPRRQRIRRRTAALIAGGLGANLLLIVLLAPAARVLSLHVHYAPLEALLLGNVLLVVSGLWPRRHYMDGVELPSDGLQLWQMMRGRGSVDALHVNCFHARAVYALKGHAREEALAAAEEGLALYPGNTVLADVRAVALLGLERHAEAVACFDAALARFQARTTPDPGLEHLARPLIEALLLNNAAYGRLLAGGGSAQREQAAELARRAFRLVPWEPFIRGTWGTALLETGRTRAGLVHLWAAADMHDTPRGRAANLAWAARAARRLGEAGLAQSLLKQALTLDPERREFEVRAAQAELQAVEGAG